jgi:hypothetical protein
MVRDEFEPPPPRRYAVGCVYLRAQGHGTRIVAIHGLEQVYAELGGMICDTKIPQIGQEPKRHYSGDGFIIVRHPDTDTVRDATLRIATLVRVEAG